MTNHELFYVVDFVLIYDKFLVFLLTQISDIVSSREGLHLLSAHCNNFCHKIFKIIRVLLMTSRLDPQLEK